MADLVITAASVLAGSNAQKASGIAGEAVTAGKPGYYDTSAKKFFLADNNSATAAARRPTCIFLNGAALNQPVSVLTEGDITIGASLTPGSAYFLSDTPGGICAFADLASGEYVSLIGLAKSASVLAVKFQSVDVAL